MRLDSSQLRSRLKLKHLTSDAVLRAHHGPAIKLLEEAGAHPSRLRQHAQKLLTTTLLAGTVLLSPTQVFSSPVALPPAAIDLRLTAADNLEAILPKDSWQLTEAQENQVTKTLHATYGIHAVASLEGNRLNNSYGLIGAEQHLMRYPGDFVENMAPGRGAWGYFAPSREALTPELVEKERYYAVVQTLYLPDWHTRLAYLRDWYKYRKVVIVNPANGKTIIADIADSGPASFTGKHFGGSPEVMAYLGLNVGMQKGAVVLFFVDDPADQVPLGPLESNLESLKIQI